MTGKSINFANIHFCCGWRLAVATQAIWAKNVIGFKLKAKCCELPAFFVVLLKFLNRIIMPLVHSEKIEENSTLLLWKLTESETELRKSLGSTYNFIDIDSISHPQKIREWLASRLLIKTLAEQFGIFYEGTHKDEHGKAFLVNNDSHISITHTFDYVAAVINLSSPVGIDMEKMDEKLRRTAKKFLSDSEYVQAENQLASLCTYWCAKEAIYKLYGKKKISFKDSIYIEPFSVDEKQIHGILTDETVKVNSPIHLRWFDDYCLAIAL